MQQQLGLTGKVQEQLRIRSSSRVLTDVSTAAALNSAITDEAQIRLTADITLSEYLKIGQSSTQNVTIDLNNYTLKRTGLTKADANGHVIEVFTTGTLTLYGGTLTGGWANNGGGICNYGTATLSNVTITGCQAKQGGAIKNNSGATLTLNGGVTISGNKCAYEGGGIWSDGTLNISGDNTITDNIRSSTLTDNVFLNTGKVINVTGSLGNSHIGVNVSGNSGIVTSGLSSNGDASDFSNDYVTITDLSTDGGEIKLTAKSGTYYVSRSWDDTKVIETLVLLDNNCTEITSAVGQEYTLEKTDSWYVVRGSNVQLGRVNINDSNVNLILCDGAKLSAVVQTYDGKSNYLNIYGQSDNPEKMGQLIADARGYSENLAGIGGGYSGDGTGITVYGGKIEATGYENGAGIGGAVLGDGGILTVYGGDITARGGKYAAGIGGGRDGNGANVTIYGGNVWAYGGTDAAGIGSGEESVYGIDGGTLNVYGGYVYADGTGWGAGIGGGEDSDGATVNIYGGTVEAWAGADAGNKNGSAIGSEDGDEHRGSLEIGNTLMVTAGSNPSSASLFEESLRKPACFWRPYARIEPCTHKGASYTVSGTTSRDTHTLNCAYCKGFTGQHNFVGDVCTVCGVRSSVYTVSIYFPAKDGETFTVYYSATPQEKNVVADATITLPSVPDDYVPAGLMFVGWVVGAPGTEEGYYAQQSDELHTAGSSYTVTGSVSLKARYNTNNISLANASENYSLLFENDGKNVNSVTFEDHTFYKDGNWNTICLPFDLTIAGSPLNDDGVDVRTLESSTWSDGVLTLNFTAFGAVTTLEAGKPYLIKWDESGADFTGPIFSNVKITKDTKAVDTDYVTFMGTYDPVDIYVEEKPTYLYMGADNKLYYTTNPLFNVNTCRGYFALRQGLYAAADGIHDANNENDSQVRQIVLNFGDDVTGVQEVSGFRIQDSGSDATYNLNGQKVADGYKGIVIKNGKKYLK